MARAVGNAKPRQPAEHIELVRNLCRHIEANLESPLTLQALGTHVGMSPAHLQRVFKYITGLTPRQYADACRMGRLKQRLKQRSSIVNAMFEAGFNSTSRLYERAPAQLGMTPATYRNGGVQTHIRWTVAGCALGRLLLAGTDRGICAVKLGDGDRALQAELFAEYPAAEFERDDAGLRAWANAVVSHLAGTQPHLDLPLDVRATAFQWRVWQELRAIPYGQTASYSEVARRIKKPKAVRAVARACATNPVAIIVPCHRVVRDNGALAGYRWGLERKKTLLEQEKKS
jgi:AraC family transcriptional regulator of adaptative response/methylated-DNA-[protein]-cysteine methyltransferase